MHATSGSPLPALALLPGGRRFSRRWMANVDPVVATDIRAFEGDDAIITAIPRALELWSILGLWAGRASLRPCSLRKSVNNGRYSGPSFWAPKTLAVAAEARISLLRLSDEPESPYCLRLTQGLQSHWRANGDEGCATYASRSCIRAHPGSHLPQRRYGSPDIFFYYIWTVHLGRWCSGY